MEKEVSCYTVNAEISEKVNKLNRLIIKKQFPICEPLLNLGIL